MSVLSRISNCQSLGRKNKHEILKTDRNDNSSNIIDMDKNENGISENDIKYDNSINDITISNNNDNNIMRFCYSGLQSEGPPRHEHNSDTKRGVASAMKPPDNKNNKMHTYIHPYIFLFFLINRKCIHTCINTKITKSNAI